MSVAAIGDVYTRMRAGASFEDAFTQVFGLTPDQFSIEFEAWRPSFQQVTELPDDFYPSTGQAVASPVTLQVVPASVGRDQQAIVTASTGPLAACGASLQLGSGTIERETVANGEGNVFWLFSIPPDAPVGRGEFDGRLRRWAGERAAYDFLANGWGCLRRCPVRCSPSIPERCERNPHPSFFVASPFMAYRCDARPPEVETPG